MESIICYFCTDAVEEKRPIGRAVVVTCPTCGRYLLDDSALRFILEREDDNEILDAEDKKKLSDYVKNKFDSKTDQPVKIDTDVIFEVTGKRSEEFRYR